MNINIEIPANEVPEYVEFLKNKADALGTKIISLTNERDQILDRIAKLTGGPYIADVTDDAPSKVKVMTTGLVLPETNIGKIKYVLLENGNKPMQTRQIVDRLIQLQPHLYHERDKVAKNISTVLSINNGAGKAFNRTQDGEGNNLFTINKEK